MSDKKQNDSIAERAAKLSERDGIPFHKAISYIMNGNSNRPGKKTRRSRKTSERNDE